MMLKRKTSILCKKNAIAETKGGKKMAFCRFCGKELVNGQCDCAEFQASIGNMGASGGTQYQQPYQKDKDPFLIPSFNLNFSSMSSFAFSPQELSPAAAADAANPEVLWQIHLSIMCLLFRIALNQKRTRLS